MQSDFGLDLTVNFYQIDVDDRIALSTQFNRGDGRAALGGGTIGDEISTLLDGAGFDNSLGGVNYFLADGSPVVQFNRARLGTYTDEFADSKLSVGAVYQQNGFRANVRTTRFGEFTNIATSARNDTENDAEWIVDLELGYEFQNGFSIFAGSNNVFNTYPSEVRPVNSLGNGFYDTISPYGFTGGNWYIRSSFQW